MDEPNPNTVTLTPSHYFPTPEQCRKRSGATWRKADPNTKVLLPEVYWWLRENVGFELNEVWDVDRYFYPDEECPELPRGHGGVWVSEGRKCFADIKHAQGEYSHDTTSGSIYFREARHAREFRAHFQKWHDSWSLIDKAMRRRFPFSSKRAAKLVRELPPIRSVASVVAMNQTVADNAFTGRMYHPSNGAEHIRVFHLFCDENTELDRVMFMLANTAPEPWFTTACPTCPRPGE